MSFEITYAIVTPAHNEESYIRFTLDSVVAQTVQPAQWIIVDDGSTDGTASIIENYTSEFPWIKLLTLKNQVRQRGGKVISAFNAGLELVDAEYEFIVKLDADLSLGNDYFEKLLYQFKINPKLGLASGGCYQRTGTEWRLEPAANDHARGLSKVYRKECFQDINGLKPVNGWDTIDELSAQMKGWETRSFNELKALHYRPTGSANGKINGKMEMGKFSYFFGYHPLAFLLRGVYNMLTGKPIILGGIAMLWGYFDCWIHHEPRFDDPQLLTYSRKKTLMDAFNFKRFRAKKL